MTKQAGILFVVVFATGVGAWMLASEVGGRSQPFTSEAGGVPAVQVSEPSPLPTPAMLLPSQGPERERAVVQSALVVAQAEAFSSAPDPCEALRETIASQEQELAWLRGRIERLQVYDGNGPFTAFMRSPDADLIQDPVKRTFLRHFMAHECPFYLQPGEALYIVDHMDDFDGYDSIEEMAIRYIGAERVLRESSPKWRADLRRSFREETWRSIFGDSLDD